jgi:hypothetical protein
MAQQLTKGFHQEIMTTEHEIHENLNFVHCVLQELETMGVELPMGDYDMLYAMVESGRDYFDVYEKDYFES